MTNEKQRKPLSMIVKGITPTLFEAGKIKIGRKGRERQGSNGTWQAPEKLDHFLITRTVRGSDNNFILDSDLISKLPKDQDGKLRRIPITLLYDSLELNFQSRYACYLGKTLFCSGDGEEANQAIPDPNKKVSGYKQVPCTCHRAEFGYEGRDKCKLTGKLQCVIRGAERIGGVHVFRTTGRNSVVSILSSLAMIHRITGGVLAGIPLDLVVSPKIVADPSGAQQTVYVVSVEFAGGMQELQNKAHNILLENAKYGLQIGRIEDEARSLLTSQPAPFAEELDDDDAGEFFPQQQGYVEPKSESNSNSLSDAIAMAANNGSSVDDLKDADPAETACQLECKEPIVNDEKEVVNDEKQPVNVEKPSVSVEKSSLKAPPKVDKPLKAEPKKEEQVEINLDDDFNPF